MKNKFNCYDIVTLKRSLHLVGNEPREAVIVAMCSDDDETQWEYVIQFRDDLSERSCREDELHFTGRRVNREDYLCDPAIFADVSVRVSEDGDLL